MPSRKSNVERVNTISPKGLPKGEDPKSKESAPSYVFGKVVGARVEQTKYGPYTRFIGAFRAKLPDGTFQESNELILTRRAERFVEAKGNAPFKLALWTVPATSTAQGYEWRYTDLDEDWDEVPDFDEVF